MKEDFLNIPNKLNLKECFETFNKEEEAKHIKAFNPLVAYEFYKNGWKAAVKHVNTGLDIKHCGLCGYIGSEKRFDNGCPSCHWNSLKELEFTIVRLKMAILLRSEGTRKQKHDSELYIKAFLNSI